MLPSHIPEGIYREGDDCLQQTGLDIHKGSTEVHITKLESMITVSYIYPSKESMSVPSGNGRGSNGERRPYGQYKLDLYIQALIGGVLRCPSSRPIRTSCRRRPGSRCRPAGSSSTAPIRRRSHTPLLRRARWARCARCLVVTLNNVHAGRGAPFGPRRGVYLPLRGGPRGGEGRGKRNGIQRTRAFREAVLARARRGEGERGGAVDDVVVASSRMWAGERPCRGTRAAGTDGPGCAVGICAGGRGGGQIVPKGIDPERGGCASWP